MSRSVSILLCTLSLGNGLKDSSVVFSFEDFQFQHGLNYTFGTTEYHKRREIFHASLAAVEHQNAKPDRLWTAGINFLSDRTPEEMKAFYGWRGGVHKSAEPSAFLQKESSTSTVKRIVSSVSKHVTQLANKISGKSTGDFGLPEDKNYLHLWTAQKAQIHNQDCGNCWAAATASLLEAHAEIHMKEKRHFSFKEITGCTENPFACGGDGGCGGATPELGLAYVMKNGIGDEEGGYDKCAGTKHIVDKAKEQKNKHHEARAGVRNADPNDKGRKLGMVAWERLDQNKYEPVLRALVERGPVAVAVDPSWSNYNSGIYDGCSEDATITHSVLAMGYGNDKKLRSKYWLIQNSWGSSFGEDGHIRLKRYDEEEKHCGTDSQPELGTTCGHESKSVPVCGSCGMLYDVTVPHFKPHEKQ